ncbi:hypothetical protein [Streptomyces sp. NPDC006638]|uniref:hypothetical protein n=1 Tax=Streptomyces sp. NPDC006638 TaxID=3157183 RepID=UPI0033BADEFF
MAYKADREAVREADQAERLEVAVGSFVTVLLLLPVKAWLLMLVVGAVHGIFAPVMAVGYGTALLLMIGVDLAADVVKQFRS